MAGRMGLDVPSAGVKGFLCYCRSYILGRLERTLFVSGSGRRCSVSMLYASSYTMFGRQLQLQHVLFAQVSAAAFVHVPFKTTAYD